MRYKEIRFAIHAATRDLAGNNDLVEGIGGKKPTPLQDFITDHLPEFTS